MQLTVEWDLSPFQVEGATGHTITTQAIQDQYFYRPVTIFDDIDG